MVRVLLQVVEVKVEDGVGGRGGAVVDLHAVDPFAVVVIVADDVIGQPVVLVDDIGQPDVFPASLDRRYEHRHFNLHTTQQSLLKHKIQNTGASTFQSKHNTPEFA